ncbi:PEBP-like protein [Saitoella complicata NRRL Y-17804]|uniref:PEBP-like protein n=1 Tax=Saitoella complicata (strain BCRC 22490 / CBS 7301 / JCM 7358 / NBRC 10748 / NRRL Y-17804) TaxID=698492 RepID=UPI00086787C9|nr:PEBP-like protein [Saitoella complicata NRRL Y-17804]ODQ55094.1 PEBP-like protein [Saitoella complicata NRRL Y-17804]
MASISRSTCASALRAAAPSRLFRQQAYRTSVRWNSSSTEPNARPAPGDPDTIGTVDPADQAPPASPIPAGTANKNRISRYAKPYPRLEYPNPPLGVNPAYDEALKVIDAHREVINEKIRQEKRKITLATAKLNKFEQFETGPGRVWKDNLDGYCKNLEYFEVQRDIDSPEFRWRHENGDVDMSKPVFRYLAKQDWEFRPLPVLMQRLETMFVVPDTLPSITPVVDLRLRFNGSHIVEPGSWVELDQCTNAPPAVEIVPFEDGENTYTVLLVDPDTPNVEDQTYNTTLLWAVSDVKISPTFTEFNAAHGTEHAQFIPPHPTYGIKYHRYTMLAFRQPTEKLKMEGYEIPGGTFKFDLRTFVEDHELEPVGASFWRAKWTEGVSERIAKETGGLGGLKLKRIKA